MTNLTVLERPVKFHLSLNVADLDRSVAFYRLFFGVEPAKCHADYAKFEIEDPPTVFSLTPHPIGRGGAMSHMGIRFTDEAAVLRMQARLEAAGIRTRRAGNSRGCYAVQDKVWVEDPDQNLWEIYIVREDLFQADVAGDNPVPASNSGDGGPDRQVIYKGPFREIATDDGRRYPRGVAVTAPAGVWESLRESPLAGSFVFSTPAAQKPCQ